MMTRTTLPLAVVGGFLALVVISGCGQRSSSTEYADRSRADSAAGSASSPLQAMPPSVASESGGAAGSAAPSDNAAGPAAAPIAPSAGDAGSRKIIKDGTLEIEVDRVELAISRVTAAAAQAGGYVIETRTQQGEGGPLEATVKFAVPEAKFEATMDVVRQLAKRVVSDAATGVDVSQEYVDLESELANLEATRARVRAFLDDAKTVEEALQVNAELTKIEGEIGQRKGRLQFLAQRTAFSTITVTVRRAPGNETPTPVPTSTPVPPLEPWHPSETVVVATRALQEVLRLLVDLAVWFVIVWLPVLVILGVVVWALRRARGWWLARLGRKKEPAAE